MESIQRDRQNLSDISISSRTFLPKTFPLINQNHILRHFPKVHSMKYQTFFKIKTDVFKQVSNGQISLRNTRSS
jgi:hypothetical protein